MDQDQRARLERLEPFVGEWRIEAPASRCRPRLPARPA